MKISAWRSGVASLHESQPGRCTVHLEVDRGGPSRGLFLKKLNQTQTTTIETKTQAETLTAEEERLFRMRTGATLDGDELLESKLDDVAEEHRADVAARLALIQAEIIAAMNQSDDEREDRRQRIVDALKGVEPDQ